MLQPRSIQSSLSIRDKILSLDFILVISILVLGITSMFAMYSTDGGEFKYHTNSHILRFFVFFGMFFVVSFISIRFWHETSYLIYIGVFILLIGVKYFGLTSSGSKRWLDLYFMNLQPSELMKIGLILFLAKYYHRISIEGVNNFRYLLLPITVLIAPVILVATQPDLGTSILIAAGGVSDSKSAYAKILCGAHLVQLYSSMTFDGPLIAENILKGLLQLMNRDKISSIKDIRGIVDNPEDAMKIANNGLKDYL